MSKFTSILENLIILDSTIARGVGKTTKLMQIAKELDAVFIKAHQSPIRDKDLKCIPWNSEELIGMTKPVIYDNYALQTIFQQAHDEIEILERRICKLEEKIQQKDSILFQIRDLLLKGGIPI